MQQYLNNGGNVNSYNESGTRLLALSTHLTNLSTIRLLLQCKDVDPYLMHKYGKVNPAMSIVLSNNRGIIWLLMNSGHMNIQQLKNLNIEEKYKKIAYSVLQDHEKYTIAKKIATSRSNLFTSANYYKKMTDILYSAIIKKEQNTEALKKSYKFFIPEIAKLYGAALATYRIVQWQPLAKNISEFKLSSTTCLNYLKNIKEFLTKYKKYDTHEYKGHFKSIQLIAAAIKTTTIICHKTELTFTYNANNKSNRNKNGYIPLLNPKAYKYKVE